MSRQYNRKVKKVQQYQNNLISVVRSTANGFFSFINLFIGKNYFIKRTLLNKFLEQQKSL